MKKTILIFVICILAVAGMRAQDIDTLPCGQRVKDYYYQHWHDTSEFYLHPDTNHINEYSVMLQGLGMASVCRTIAYQHYTDTPLRIRGLWALVSQDAEGHGINHHVTILDSTKLPEYLYLYVRNPKVQMDSITFDTSRWLLPVAHARWDTNQPKMFCLQKFADGRYGYDYCYLYEAIFDSTITIQGEFWIGGTANSNLRGTGINVNPYTPYPYFPTIYMTFGRKTPSYGSPYNHYTFNPSGCCSPEGPFTGCPEYLSPWYYGPFGAITDGQHLVQLSSADSAQGEALYSSFYPDSSYQTITAVPAHGFRFSHWNDGDTTNPRTVFVTQDTAFTAYFLPAPLHSVTVRSSNNAFGYTTGDSTYYENDPAVIKAVPLDDSIHFLHWNDSVTDNPRTIIVMQDTAFTAYFEPIPQPEGIVAPDSRSPLFTLTPNPARNSVTVTLNSQLPILNSQFSLTLSDAAGRELLNTKVSTHNFQLPISQYPAGTYFVTLRSPDTTSTQRLVIE